MRTLQALLPCALALLTACSGNIGGTGDDPDSGPRPDVGVPPLDSGPDAFAACGETGLVLLHLEERCGSSSCHGGGGRFPLLTRDGIAALSGLESRTNPGERLLVPGDPDASWLYRKMAGLQGDDGGALMPLGTSTPSAESTLIADWIRDGANTSCDELPPTRLPYDPNSLDQAELFSCADPSAERASPSRIRRIERQEFTHAVLRRLGTTAARTSVRENPLSVPGVHPYSSYTDGVSIDEATLDLLILNLPEAAGAWARSDPGTLLRMEGLYGERDHQCIDREADPTDECRGNYINNLLRRGSLFRAPSDGERTRLRAALDQGIAAEADPDADRQTTLSRVAQSALLMTGSLFRSEMGDETGRLTNDELALALGHVLTSHPVGVPFVNGTVTPGHPDVDDRGLGRLTAVRRAADDGTIQDAATRVALVRRYAGGMDADRPDIGSDEDDRTIMFRGAYWLAPNFAGFFREWLDYEEIGFKDTPAETSRYDGVPDDDSTRAFGALQSNIWSRRHQPTLIEQLDDAIARIVFESDQNGEDVFQALMTSRQVSLPSTRDVGGNEGIMAAVAHPYGVDDVANDPAARWTVLPDTERLGVLTHPAWLASHGANFEEDASLVLRGKWIREGLFCETVPPLELVMVEAQLVPASDELSARERVRVSTETGPDGPTCLGCHRLMNPLGNAFEMYNHAGFLRAEDHGGPPDGSTVIENLPDPALNRAYATPLELIQAIADSSYARRGFIRHAFRYFMGRDETLADGCTLAEMEAALDADGSFFSMIEALVASDTFVRRFDADAMMGGSR